jgi:hypothetical protein
MVLLPLVLLVFLHRLHHGQLQGKVHLALEDTASVCNCLCSNPVGCSDAWQLPSNRTCWLQPQLHTSTA